MNHVVEHETASTRTLILGLGITGQAAVRWCARAGARLRVADTRRQPPVLAALQAALPSDADVQWCLGEAECTVAMLEDVSELVLSPGLSPLESPTREILAAAVERGVPVVGEIELFARALAELAASRDYHPRVLAVTGTNGKTTVTALTRRLIEASGMTARAAGNIGPAALDALMQALDEDTLPQAWVLELSSFQLETTQSLVADAAVVLNVTQDHLDWHGSMQAYAQAKSRIYGQARIKLVNRDDPAVMAMVGALEQMDVLSFGSDAPTLAGDMGLDGMPAMTWLAACESSDFAEPAPTTTRRKKNEPAPVRAGGRVNHLMPMDAMRIRGKHNALNALAALALARVLGASWAPMLRELQQYQGEPHRTQFVRRIADVDFVNDSKGTNVGAAVAALEGLGQRIVLIAGGLGKGQDFSPLAQTAALHTRAVVLIGQDGPIIAQALEATGVSHVSATDMRDAVAQAMALAKEGDAVLLSPACASMDMFRNYPHRGDVFVDEVERLAADRGEIV